MILRLSLCIAFQSGWFNVNEILYSTVIQVDPRAGQAVMKPPFFLTLFALHQASQQSFVFV